MLKTYIKSIVENIPSENIEKDIDLVLDGGAFNGSYMIGSMFFLKYLESQNKVKIHRVSGCSIGALIGLAFIYNKLDMAWKIGNSSFHVIRKTYDLSLFKKKLEKYLREIIENESIDRLQNKFYLTYFDFEKSKQIVNCKYKNAEDLIKKLMKTIHVPFVIDRNITDNEKHIDGLFPYFFKEREHKVLFINLQGWDKIKNMLFIKYEKNLYSRFIHGIMDIHDFYQHKKPTSMCSYVNDWSLISIVNQNLKEGLIVCSVHMMYYLVYLFDQLTPFVKDTHLYKQLMYLINKCYEEIIIYITT